MMHLEATADEEMQPPPADLQQPLLDAKMHYCTNREDCQEDGQRGVPSADISDINVGMRLCVNDHAIKLTSYMDEEYAVISNSAPKRDIRWLLAGVGLKSLEDLPEQNTLKRLSCHIKELRGGHKRMTRKVDKRGEAQPLVIETEFEGQVIKVRNQIWPIYFKPDVSTTKWLIERLKHDMLSSSETASTRTPSDKVIQTADAVSDGQPQLADVCSGDEGHDKDEPQEGRENTAETDDHEEQDDQTAISKALDKERAKLPHGVFWAASKLSFIANNPGRKNRKQFKLRTKNMKTLDDAQKEIHLQIQMALHYHNTGNESVVDAVA